MYPARPLRPHPPAVPVHGDSAHVLPTPAQLDAAVADCDSKRCAVKALLLTNPSNPLGVVYTLAELTAAMTWWGDAQGGKWGKQEGMGEAKEKEGGEEGVSAIVFHLSSFVRNPGCFVLFLFFLSLSSSSPSFASSSSILLSLFFFSRVFNGRCRRACRFVLVATE